MTPIRVLIDLVQLIDIPQLRKRFSDILHNCLLIPKPKFKVGDKVKDEFNDTHYIYECCYDLSKNRWWYLTLYGNKFYESELELVERKEDVCI